MAYITGYDTYAGIGIATTWGTAVNATIPHQGEINWSANVQELIAKGIGSGRIMNNAVTFGEVKPTVSLTMFTGFRNAFPYLLAALMGTSGAPSEVTGGQADYLHTITLATAPTKYVTFAFKSASATVIEFPTAAVVSMNFKTTTIPGYFEVTFELMADQVKFSSTENTTSELAALTLTDSELATAYYSDDFWINAQSGGSLSSGDGLAITNYELTLTRPMEQIGEINASGDTLGAPRPADQFEGTLKITTSSLADNTYMTAWGAETVYKSRFVTDGTQIGTGTVKSVYIYLPGMKMVSSPTYNVTDNGVNTASYEFRLLKAGSNPTGMSSTYPYFTVTNGLSTSLLA